MTSLACLMAVWKIIFNFSPIQNVPFFEEFYFYCKMNFLRTLFYFRKTSMQEWLRRLIHPLRPDALIKKFRSKIFLSLNGETKFYESLITTHVNSSHPHSGRRKKINRFLQFFMKALKPFEAPQRGVKIKIS